MGGRLAGASGWHFVLGGCVHIFRSGGVEVGFGDGVGGPNGFYSFSFLVFCLFLVGGIG